MTAFNFMASDQVVKVQCTVQNSNGQIAYDIYEFYQNTPPASGSMLITPLTNPALGNGTTVDSVFSAQL